jgi:catechol 2,3-dioxygenase-like lactoylglutathione lyase family enzyme
MRNGRLTMAEKAENGPRTFKIDKVGIVVNDVEQAIAFFQRIGIGPFTVMDVEVGDGKLKVGFFQQDNLLIELMEPIEGDTIHAKFLKEKGPGIEILGNVFCENFQRHFQMMQDKGFKLLDHGQIMGSQFALFDARDQSGLILEIAGAI